jgi:hypothetical protein
MRKILTNIRLTSIKRTGGETRTHLYAFPYGYPIRVCNWSIPEHKFIKNGDAPFCKHCQSYQAGKRQVAFAPIPVKDK